MTYISSSYASGTGSWAGNMARDLEAEFDGCYTFHMRSGSNRISVWAPQRDGQRLGDLDVYDRKVVARPVYDRLPAQEFDLASGVLARQAALGYLAASFIRGEGWK
ncbi:hypothetical protein [Candidatus Poriferisodalis sp.]|uniref:hypothetical protein n=1 Tax=Candidatus Poriferisodalis sp. TaxID=3101277 RepID=UPI003B02552D